MTLADALETRSTSSRVVEGLTAVRGPFPSCHSLLIDNVPTGGRVTNSQLFTFAAGSTGPIALQPRNAVGTCFVVREGRLDQAGCDGSEAQVCLFAFVEQ